MISTQTCFRKIVMRMAFPTLMLLFVMPSFTFGQENKVSAPQITNITYEGTSVWPRYTIEFVAPEPGCTFMTAVVDSDGRFSYDRGRMDTGGDDFYKGSVSRSDRRQQSTSVALFRGGEEWLNQGNQAYAYMYSDSFTGCYSDVSNVVVLHPPIEPPEFCPVTPQSQCQLRTNGSSATSTIDTREISDSVTGETRQQGQCVDCNKRCAARKEKLESHLAANRDACRLPGVICGIFTFFKTHGPGQTGDTLGDFIDECFDGDPQSSPLQELPHSTTSEAPPQTDERVGLGIC